MQSSEELNWVSHETINNIQTIFVSENFSADFEHLNYFSKNFKVASVRMRDFEHGVIFFAPD